MTWLEVTNHMDMKTIDYLKVVRLFYTKCDSWDHNMLILKNFNVLKLCISFIDNPKNKTLKL
jgi:hypothetical protein